MPAWTCATQSTAHTQAGRPVHQAQRPVSHRFWLTSVTVPLGREKKPTDQCLSGRSRGSGSGHVVQLPRQTKTWSSVPRDLILGAEHDRNQQGARAFLGPYSRAARGGKQQHQHQHQHQQAKQQSASSPHSSRGPCFDIFRPPTPDPTAQAPWPCGWTPVYMPGLRSRCRCGKHTPSLCASPPPHGTETPKAIGNAAKDRDGSRGAWAPLRLECDSITNQPASSPCVFASRLGTWCTVVGGGYF